MPLASKSVPSAALARSLSSSAQSLKGALGSWAWAPALALVKPAILAVFARIDTGTLLLVDESQGTRHVFGQKLSAEPGSLDAATGLPRRATTVPRVEIVVKSEAVWMRLFLFADMGFAEAYMLGELQCEDLTSFFRVSPTGSLLWTAGHLHPCLSRSSSLSTATT